MFPDASVPRPGQLKEGHPKSSQPEEDIAGPVRRRGRRRHVCCQEADRPQSHATAPRSGNRGQEPYIM